MLVSYLMSVTSGTIKIAIRVEKSLNRLRRLVPLIREKIGLCFIKRSREGWSTTDAVVVVTYITRQIFNCIFSIVKERQGVPYGLYQSHTQPLSSCSFAFDRSESVPTNGNIADDAASYQSLLRDNKAKLWKKNLVRSIAFHMRLTPRRCALH